MWLESSIFQNLSSRECRCAKTLSSGACKEETTRAEEGRLCFCLFACRVSTVRREVAGYGLSTEESSSKSVLDVITFLWRMRTSTSASGVVRCALVRGGSLPLGAPILSSLKLTASSLSSASASSSYSLSSTVSSSTCEEEAGALPFLPAGFGGTLRYNSSSTG